MRKRQGASINSARLFLLLGPIRTYYYLRSTPPSGNSQPMKVGYRFVGEYGCSVQTHALQRECSQDGLSVLLQTQSKLSLEQPVMPSPAVQVHVKDLAPKQQAYCRRMHFDIACWSNTDKSTRLNSAAMRMVGGSWTKSDSSIVHR